MTDVRKFAWVGVACTLGLGLASIGCGSKTGETGTGGTGGSSATGGKGGGSSTGGSTGNGGSSAGGASGGPTTGCLASDPPASAEIADFSGADGGIGIEIMHGDNDPFTYGDNPPPGFTPMPGSIEVTDNIAVGAKNHYQGFGIYFNGNMAGTDCIDASSYTGVQFDIKGSLVGDLCTVQFSINDSEHADRTVAKSGITVSFDAGVDGGFMPNDPKASGPMGAYAPQLQIGPMIMSASTTIKVPFAGTGSDVPVGGLPADTAIDTKRIEGVQWQLTTPLAGDGAASECDLDMTISNVKFYK
jgi:hypothetical protein